MQHALKKCSVKSRKLILTNCYNATGRHHAHHSRTTDSVTGRLSRSLLGSVPRYSLTPPAQNTSTAKSPPTVPQPGCHNQNISLAVTVAQSPSEQESSTSMVTPSSTKWHRTPQGHLLPLTPPSRYCSTGKPLAFSSCPYTTQFPHPGWAEQNPADWWAALGTAVRAAVAEAKVSPDSIVAICLDTTNCTVVALDAGVNICVYLILYESCVTSAWPPPMCCCSSGWERRVAALACLEADRGAGSG